MLARPLRALGLAALLQLSTIPDAPAQSVYKLSVPRDIALTGIAGAMVLVPYAFPSTFITPRCPCDPGEVNRFDRGTIGKSNGFLGTVSDVSAGIAIIAPFAMDYLDVGAAKPFLEDAVVMAQTIAVNGALVTLTKYLTRRPFPDTYAGNPDLMNSPRGYRAFYSGHTSLAFAAMTAAAMTARRRHGEKVWPWVVTVLFGSSVALEMVVSGRHFPTDVIAGAVAGTATGIAIPLLHFR
jgi:membrane-associated phospholipid phosphatase